MANNMAREPSPRLAALHGSSVNPSTPVHSPHHSLHSSTSSRTPLQTLSLHEYRKLQNTPTSQTSTPPGRTLRRKAATPTLNGLERVPSISRTPLSGARVSSRPLHFSQSAQQLSSYQPLPPSPPNLNASRGVYDGPLRSHSTEPSSWGGRAFGVVEEEPRAFTPKVGNWKPIKRLPKPRSAFPPAQLFSAPAPASTTNSLTPLRTTPASSTEHVPSSGGLTTPSLSRFPHPPNLIDLSLSPPNDEDGAPHLNTSFTTTAPVTPPATPAVIHYRGTSFDLVNPHDSLLLHDIVTPSRELDSTEYLPLSPTEEPLLHPDMAPRRPLFGDFSSAHKTITNRNDAPSTPDLDPPLPPIQAALSTASEYSSPGYSYDSNLAPSPLDVKKSPGKSRLSLKQLTSIKDVTRTISARLGKSPQSTDHELQPFATPTTSPTVGQFGGEYPRPLTESYPASPDPSYHPPSQFTQSELPEDLGASYISGANRQFSEQQIASAPLTSMVPDDPSSQFGRVQNQRVSALAGDTSSRAYYDEVSLYQSSSIYTGDGESLRGYPESVYNNRMSNPQGPLDFEDTGIQSSYNRDSIYSFSNANRTSGHYSRPITQELSQGPQMFHNEKTDTISKIVDQYQNNRADISISSENLDHDDRPLLSRDDPGLSQFDFGLPEAPSRNLGVASAGPPMPAVSGRRPAITSAPRSPPPRFTPLAPAFEYDEMSNTFQPPSTSDVFSGDSSYGDTRNLLQLSQPTIVGADGSAVISQVTRQALEPSSSYSQNENEPEVHTPQEALDQAEQIFEEAKTHHAESGIPVIWARRGSGNLLRNKQATLIEDAGEERGDWETVGDQSRRDRPSMDDSVANYSSTEGDDESVDRFQESSLPALPALEYDGSLYRHPSPLSGHEHPFTSSPPALGPEHTRGAPPQVSRAPSPPYARTVPVFQSRTYDHHVEPYFFMPDQPPWVRPSPSPYDLTEKETQELLNSGPNDEILYENCQDAPPSSSVAGQQSSSPQAASESNTGLVHSSDDSVGLERENTFEKLSTVGPRGNLTGTPQGTGMRQVGSSIADTSSPGAALSSTPAKQRPAGFAGFIDRSEQSSSRHIPSESHQYGEAMFSEPPHKRYGSEDTLFPNHFRLKALPDDPPPPVPGRPRSMRSTRSRRTMSSSSYRYGRPAVAGQTKLRQMYLASDAPSISSSHGTRFSQFIGADSSIRPSSSNTNTPLRPTGTQLTEVSTKKPMASTHSPHLLCPERALDLEEENKRERLSWVLFWMLTIFPPLMILFRFIADPLISLLSRGRFRYAAAEPKRMAIPLAILVNLIVGVSITAAVLVLLAKADRI